MAAYHNKGNLLLEDLELYDEAIIAYEQALRLGSSLSAVGKAKALNKQRASQDILNAYERATRLEPRNASVYIGKGYSLSCLGQYQEALKAFQHAIHLDPNNALAHYGIAAALGYLKRPTEAQQEYQMALQLGFNEFIVAGEKRLRRMKS